MNLLDFGLRRQRAKDGQNLFFPLGRIVDGFYNVYDLSGFLSDGTDLTGKSLKVENNGDADYKFINTAVVREPGVDAIFR